MADDAFELIKLRNNFYRDNYRRVVGILLLMIIANVVLISIIWYLVINRPAPQYFATTSDGRILPIYPLSQPVLSKAELLQWASQAAVAVYNFNFVDYRASLQKASESFTADGWKAFEDGLKSSRNLETVIAKKLTVHAVATGAPIVRNEGVINGRYAWYVQMPILITYESASENIQQPVVVDMMIVRIPTVDNPKGIAIVQFYAAEQAVGAR